MRLTVVPGNPLKGTVELPGDKSLSHRAVLFSALANGESRIENFLVSGVTRAMLEALRAMGVDWELHGSVLRVQGKGLSGLRAPDEPLNCGNSATTLRLLAGVVAAAGIPAVLTGSEGLRRRPMGRIVDPLTRMGVPIQASEGGSAPLVLSQRPAGTRLNSFDQDMPVASAQVKSCLLLAALAAQGETVLREPGPSRDHTERMLASMGVQVANRVLADAGGSPLYETRLSAPDPLVLKPLHLRLPGDISSAAFLIVAGLVTPGSEIRIRGVGLNPTRTGILDALLSMGADLQVESHAIQGGEPAGDVLVRSSRLRGTLVSGSLVVRMIDEFSVFGAAAAYAEGQTEVREALELRYKESDRIATLCRELSALGIQTEEYQDGFKLWGSRPHGGTVQTHGDHRVAMAMTIAGLASSAPVVVDGAEMMNESFPGFIKVLRALGAELHTEGEWVESSMAAGEGEV
jgi:3-phosphoshikimate 1-carboxyvinyltransferase